MYNRNLRLFSSYYPLAHAPDLYRLAYVGDAKWNAHLDIRGRQTLSDLVKPAKDSYYYGQGSYPTGSWAGTLALLVQKSNFTGTEEQLSCFTGTKEQLSSFTGTKEQILTLEGRSPGVFYGKIYIEIGGLYTWCAKSKDGSRVLLTHKDSGTQVAVAKDQITDNAEEQCGVLEVEEDTWYDLAVDFFTTSQDFRLLVQYSGPDTNEKKEILNSWGKGAYPPPPQPSQWGLRTFSSGHALYSIERLAGLNYVGAGKLPWPIIYSSEYLQAVVTNTPASNFVYQFWGTFQVTQKGDHHMCVQVCVCVCV